MTALRVTPSMPLASPPAGPPLRAIAGWRARDEDPAVAACRREAIRLASRIHALSRDLAANMAELRQFTAAQVP